MRRLPTLPRRIPAAVAALVCVLSMVSTTIAAPSSFDVEHVVAVDPSTDALDPRADLLSLALRPLDGGWELRVGLSGGPDVDLASLWASDTPLEVELRDGTATLHLDAPVARAKTGDDGESVRLVLPAGDAATAWLESARAKGTGDGSIIVRSRVDGEVADEIVAVWPRSRAKVFIAHCAFAHHGNQGLAYTDAFFGSGSDPDGTGFDEALQVHEGTGVPGNFHVSGTLITAAEWDRNQGNPSDFNGWLRAGVQNGWAAMLTSAYAQHIMPFVRDEMNDWAVSTQAQLVDHVYGYTPRTAWVPERVWLDPSRYPSAGVIDWPGDDFLPHGVWSVILDDDVHLSGWDNHQIHSLSNGLRVIPRDRDFTGNIVGGNGQASLDILSGLANSGVGDFRLAVFAEDWEAVGEIGFWRDVTPQAKETYDWFIGKVASEPWIQAWRLDDAVQNPNFNGASIAQLGTGTYVEIGGADGYGGGNNGWYTDWAGFVPYVTGGDGSGNCAGTGGNCRDYGTMWNAAISKLLTVPDNNLSQSGWYTLMTNLHETAWHDGLGAPISGWQHKYSAHVKNALVHAEAARWAGGEYVDAVGAFQADLDEDGYDEVVLYNERVFAYFEGTGGRAVNVFAKGGAGGEFSAVGVDNAYWYGTEADYNDGNHVGAYSDVGPDRQHEPYAWSFGSTSGPEVEVTFTHASGLEKTISLASGEPWLRSVYRTHGGTQWIQTGMSPGLVDLVWNAQMERVWATDQAYMGRRNPNTGATVAYVLGAGGAGHQREISATLMKGDEIFGNDTFEFYLFAGTTAAPVGGEFAELRTLADGLVDVLGPRAESSIYLPGTDRLRVVFDQPVEVATVDPTGLTVDEDGTGQNAFALDPTTAVVETGLSATLTLELTSTDAAALAAMDPTGLTLLVDPSAGVDANGVAAMARSVPLTVGEPTAVTIDGHLEDAEWRGPCHLAFVDPPVDSDWTSANELDALYARWDETYLYLAIDGVVDGNSWVLYLDTDPDGGEGQTDLTTIDSWERGATFTAPGFAPDFQYGAYQHQGAFDSDSFFRLDSATTSTDLSDQVPSAFDSQHTHEPDGGSEIAIPWDLVYGLGEGVVPVGAEIGVAVSLCWDPEPDGELGGDSIPGSGANTLPVVSDFVRWTVDADADGLPDPEDTQGPQLLEIVPSPATGLPKTESTLPVEVHFDEAVASGPALDLTNYSVYETSNPTNVLQVRSAEILAGFPRSVVLGIEEPELSGNFTVVITDATDISCNANVTPVQSGTVNLERVTAAPGAGVARLTLYPNVPNPFNPSTRLRFAIPSGGARRVDLRIYDLRGRRVRSLVDGEELSGGEHTRIWRGRDDRGRAVASGEYLVRLRADGTVRTSKVSLSK